MATGDVAWDGTTTSIRPVLMYKTPRGVTYGQTSNWSYSTQTRDAAYSMAGCAKSTGDDLIRIPFRKNGELLISIEYNQCAAAGQHPGIILQRPPKSKNAVYGYSTDYSRVTGGAAITSSTKDAGWVMLVSPSSCTAAATSHSYLAHFVVHPGPYAFNDGASTGEGTNAYENYIVMAPVLTAARGDTNTLKSTQFVSLQCSSFGYNIAHVHVVEYA